MMDKNRASVPIFTPNNNFKEYFLNLPYASSPKPKNKTCLGIKPKAFGGLWGHRKFLGIGYDLGEEFFHSKEEESGV
jgi:hypothetical protein